MASKQSARTGPQRGYPLWLAKRAGLGMSGALQGAITAAYLLDVGVSPFDPLGTSAALMIFGWSGGFIGVSTKPPAATGREKHGLPWTAEPSERLSAAGTLIANATAFIAAWLLLSRAAPAIPRAIAIGFCWLFGVTLQIAAGALARLGAVDPGIA
jgi:hypothetical protein